MNKRIMIKRELKELMPNEEAIYIETFSDGSSFESLLSWCLDGCPHVMEYSNTENARDESERQAIINKLICIDSNGVWSDEDNIANDYEPMSLQEAKEALYRIEHRDDEPEFDLATVAKEIGGDYVNTGGHCYMVTKDLYNGFVIAITDDCIAIYENFEAIFDGSFDSCNTPVYSI